MRFIGGLVLCWGACAATQPEYLPSQGADFNGDGFADFVVYGVEKADSPTDQDTFSRRGQAQLYIYYGSASGLRARPTQKLHVPRVVYKLVSLGDITGDGIDDLVVQLQTELVVYPGSKRGLRRRQRDAFPILEQVGYMVALRPAGDIDGDDRSDFLSGTYLFRTGKPRHYHWDIARIAGHACDQTEAAGDSDGDGLVDVSCVARDRPPSVVGWSRKDKRLVRKDVSPRTRGRRYIAFDFNGDGKQDTVTLQPHRVSGYPLQDGSMRTFPIDFDAIVDINNKSQRLRQRSYALEVIPVGDTNGDNRDDLILWAFKGQHWSNGEQQLYLYVGGTKGLRKLHRFEPKQWHNGIDMPNPNHKTRTLTIAKDRR